MFVYTFPQHSTAGEKSSNLFARLNYHNRSPFTFWGFTRPLSSHGFFDLEIIIKNPKYFVFVFYSPTALNTWFNCYSFVLCFISAHQLGHFFCLRDEQNITIDAVITTQKYILLLGLCFLSSTTDLCIGLWPGRWKPGPPPGLNEKKTNPTRPTEAVFF